jgi:pimeloyl-ACP methyl ester carboxylesterase
VATFAFIHGIPLGISQTTISEEHKTVSGSSHEDFTSTSLAGSSLHADAPENIETTDEANFIREWITLQWRPDDPIYLYVVRPKRVVKSPVVIYLYDYPAETDIFRDDDWCEQVTAGGFAAVGFVPALNGHRYHGVPMKEWFVSRLQESLAKSAHDVQMVLSYLESRGDVDTNRAGVFGVGAGATIAALAASADSRIKAVDLIDPWGDWPKWMQMSEVVPEEERSTYLKEDFLKNIAPFDPVAVLPVLTTSHVRLVQFGQGTVTPAASQKRIAAALPANGEREQFATLAEFEGGNDTRRALQWIKSHINPSRTSMQSASQNTVHKEENR